MYELRFCCYASILFFFSSSLSFACAPAVYVKIMIFASIGTEQGESVIVCLHASSKPQISTPSWMWKHSHGSVFKLEPNVPSKL